MAFNILKTAATLIGFEGGSQITGQRAFVMGEGTRIAMAMMLVSEAHGHKLETTVARATATFLVRELAKVQVVEKRRTLTRWNRRRQRVHTRTV